MGWEFDDKRGTRLKLRGVFAAKSNQVFWGCEEVWWRADGQAVETGG